MPNYSHNKLTIEIIDEKSGYKQLELFKKENMIYNEISDEYELVFSKLIPMPKELNISTPQHTKEEKEQAKKNLKDFGYKDWYDWRVAYWGTKWNPSTISIEIKSNKITIYYDTAWAPGEPWLNKIAKRYSKLLFKFSCYEESGAYEGKGVVKDGTWKWEISKPAKWVENEQ